MSHRVHEPSCAGPHACGGAYVCRSCGRRAGWCRGDSADLGCCPDCWAEAHRNLWNRPAIRITTQHYTELVFTPAHPGSAVGSYRTTKPDSYNPDTLSPSIPPRVRCRTAEEARDWMLDRDYIW